jgi:hypothetical protein
MLSEGWQNLNVGNYTGMKPQKIFFLHLTDRVTYCIPQLDSDEEAEVKAQI